EFLVEPAPAAGGGFEAQLRGEIGKSLEAGGENVYRDLLERVERPLIESALLRTEGNQIRAARLLGINRNTLRKKIADLGISVPGREEAWLRACRVSSCWPTTTRAGAAILPRRRPRRARAGRRWCSCAPSAPATAKRWRGRARSAH